MTNNTKAHETIGRYRVVIPDQYLALLESTEDPVRIRGTKYTRYTWRGVPGRLCDVIVADSLVRHKPHTETAGGVVLDVTSHRPHNLPPALAETVWAAAPEGTVIEIGAKTGKFDGASRRRYALRWFSDRTQLEAIPHADIRIVPSDEELLIVVRPRDGAPPIVDTFARLRGTLDGYDMERIVHWHGRRYFTHLDYQNEVIPAARTQKLAAANPAPKWLWVV